MNISTLFAACCDRFKREGLKGPGVLRLQDGDLRLILNATKTEAESVPPFHIAIFCDDKVADWLPMALLSPSGGEIMHGAPYTEDQLIERLADKQKKLEVA